MSQKRILSIEERKKYISLRRKFTGPVIGITGNLGKTSTLEMIRTLLETRGRVLKNSRGHGSWQNNINTLEKLSPEYDFALFEFDYQRGNNFAEILRLIKPTIGVVTNIGDAHLNYLGSMMKTALEKSAVVKYLAQGGLAILNKDDELSSSLADYISTKNIIKFGLSHDASYYASDIEHLGPGGIRFNLNGKYAVTLPIYSIQDVYSFLAATACGINLNFTIDEIIEIFETKFHLTAGRGRLHKINDNYIIDESYSATPRSLSKAARSLTAFKQFSEQLVFIVSDMTGAGVNIEDQHLNMGYFLSALPIDCLIAVGEYAKLIAQGASLIKSPDKKIFTVDSVNEVLEVLNGNLKSNATISIKGPGSVAAHRIIKLVQNKTAMNSSIV